MDKYSCELESLNSESAQAHIQYTAIRIWWNHAIILLLSTVEWGEGVMHETAKDTLYLVFEDTIFRDVRGLFRYELYVADLPWVKKFLS